MPTFSNPIQPVDMPDPDVAALSDGGYVLVASSFDRRPGLPLWFSEDLVSWAPVGFAGGWQPRVQKSGGVWAPAIREHDGRLFVTWGDPDRGIYVVDALSISGPWSSPRLLLAGAGLIDPCPFWDDDGSAWIVHGWARSRAGFANRLSLVPVDAGLTAPLEAGRVLIDGDAIEGCTVLEGPKLYRRGDWYWVFAPAGGVETGWQYAFRSRSLGGPWEERIVLSQGASATNGPHQGAWVVGAAGEEWFLHFQHTPRHGRILHLQPLAWSDDGWPLIGQAATGGPAEPVEAWPMPLARPASVVPPTVSGWHGRDADPSAFADGFRLQPGGTLAHPLPMSATSVSVSVLSGVGALSITGAETVSTTGSGELRLSIDGERARFLPDGEWFPLVPSQWTGMDIGLTALTPDTLFSEPVIE